MDIVTDVYSVEENGESEVDNALDVESTIEPDPLLNLTDRALLIAVYRQQEQIGTQLNWLTENLAGVFNMVNTVSQNGGGVRGMMKMMKELNNG